MVVPFKKEKEAKASSFCRQKDYLSDLAGEAFTVTVVAPARAITNWRPSSSMFLDLYTDIAVAASMPHAKQLQWRHVTQSSEMTCALQSDLQHQWRMFG